MSDVEIEIGTKRSGEHDEYGEITTEKKKVRSHDTKMRFLIIGKSCGAIIGKGGENIKRLRQEHNIHFKVQDSRGEGVVTLSGEKEAVLEVFKEILPQTQPLYPANTKQHDKSNVGINLLVPNDQMGSIIGKGGETIKDIRRESDGNLRVYQEFLPNSNERVLAIGAEDMAQLLRVLDIVLQTLEDHPLKASTRVQYYNPENSSPQGGNNPPAQNQLGGGLGGLGLGGLTGIGGLGSLGNLGGLGNMTGASGVFDQLGLGGGHRNGENGDRPQFGDMETETKVTVLNDMCGAIIGKAGQRIREIRQSSGAKVDVEGNAEPRVITIKGTARQLRIALQMMDDTIRNRTR